MQKFVGALALWLGLCSLPVWAQEKNQTVSVSPKPSLTVNVALPQPSAMVLRLQANGSLAAWQEAVVGAEANGLKITEVRVNVGDRVQRGDVLATLQSDTLRAELAQAEISFVERRVLASQLRLASSVRDAWWSWQRARVDAELAREQLTNARRLAADVAKRTQAGDLARSDQHQAEGAVAAAEALAAQAQAASAVASAQLAALTGGVAAPDSIHNGTGEPSPVPSQTARHPLLAELEDRIAVAERTANLISTQKRSNPELTVATTRGRGAFGDRYGQTVLIGIRVPFGSGPRYDARIATAQAEAIEVQSKLILERDQIQADQRGAASRLEAVRTQLVAAQRREMLANESRGFFDKSFRLGETDLPTRLRIEAEAAEAARQAARSRIDLASAISALRQSLGLLPE